MSITVEVVLLSGKRTTAQAGLNDEVEGLKDMRRLNLESANDRVDSERKPPTAYQTGTPTTFRSASTRFHIPSSMQGKLLRGAAAEG